MTKKLGNKSNRKSLAIKPSHSDKVRGVRQSTTGNDNAQLSGDKSVLNVIHVHDRSGVTPEPVTIQKANDSQLSGIGWEARDNELLMDYFRQCKRYDAFFRRHVKLDDEVVREFMVTSGLARKSRDGHTELTDAGMLFCCKRSLIPRDIFHVDVRLVQRTEVEDLTNETFGSVLYLYKWLNKRLAPFLQAKISSPDNRDSIGGERLFSEYPRVAIIEALVNFLIHRDYSQNDIGWITVYPDQIEFTNPGQSEVALVQLLTAVLPIRPKYKRNPSLIEAMSKARLNQRDGSGVLRIRRELEKNESYRSDGSLGLEIENDTNNNRFTLRIFKRRAKKEIGDFSQGNSKPLPHQKVRLGSAPPLPSLLIGRADDLSNLKVRLGVSSSAAHPQIQVLTAIRGWPGVGKTTLAAGLAHDPDVAVAFPDGVLWASLGQNPSLLAELVAWGRALGVDDLLGVKTIEEASAQLTALLRNKRVLLIVDDVWDAAHAIPFKVGGRSCAMLVTTRASDVAQALAPTPEDIYRLAVLTDEKALDLLRTLAPSVVQQYPQESIELARELEGLPLALQVAGRMLNVEVSYGFGVSDLLKELREGARMLEAKSPASRVELANETTPTVSRLLQESTDRLDPLTRDCFAYLGAFAPKPATFDLMAMKAVWQIEDPKPIARQLVDRGLLEPVSETGRFQMHALLVMHAKSLLVED